jgi:stearoyl-CoA desaturase (delta-9 desaturase)
LEIFNQAAVTQFAIWFFIFYLYHGLGITLGYHRLLTHKSLKIPQWLSYLIVSGGYLCLMGSPIVWVGVHRLHHQKSDLPGDPHSPRDGFKHALFEWMYDMRSVQSDEELQKQVPDLMDDKFYRLFGCTHAASQAQLCLGINIAYRLIIWAVLGVPALLASISSMFIVFWATQFVNSFCHLESQGYRSFDTREDSRNVWWVALLSLGEGWHNNHHAVPKSARHGMAWFEFDVTWYSVWLLEKLGFAKNVIRPPKLSPAAVAVKSRTEPTFVVPSVAEVLQEPVLVDQP